VVGSLQKLVRDHQRFIARGLVELTKVRNPAS
jgi:hypothetical protein